MKKYSHAWVSLMALKRLQSQQKYLTKNYQEDAGQLLEFMGQYKDTFVQGAWFPDNPISDNTAGGHTWKYGPPVAANEGKNVSFDLPKVISFPLDIPASRFQEKVILDTRSHLPDRCEALS